MNCPDRHTPPGSDLCFNGGVFMALGTVKWFNDAKGFGFIS
ncbi:MAG: cold shock domain-containing protein, partial [Ralstonia sp.]|nr:cold shock domain-containing protein [Ralstonia sp.]